MSPTPEQPELKGHAPDLGDSARGYAAMGGESAEVSPPSFDGQVMDLLERQLKQRDALEELGILEPAAQLARVDIHNPTVKPSLRAVRELQQNGDELEVTEVVFAVTERNSAGNEQRRFVSAGVAETFGGLTMPRNGFSGEQADAIVSMADDLRQAKQNGTLPKLGDDLNEIVR